MTTTKHIYCAQLINDSIRMTTGKKFQSNAWGARHVEAFAKGGAIPDLIVAIGKVADDHWMRFESLIGDDYVLGKCWMQLLQGAQGLLDGETGNLDCGTLDGLLRAMADSQGLNGDEV